MSATIHHASGTLHVPEDTLADWPSAQFAYTKERGIVVKALGLELTSVFQAIFAVDAQTIIGEEGLLRASIRRKAISPEEVFKSASRGECLVAFDRLCRSLHLMNHLAGPQKGQTLFLNVHPELLITVEKQHGETFERILQDQGLKPGNVVLEIIEAAIPDAQEADLIRAVRNYRQRGYRIALDDYGHANLSRLLSLAPEIVKLDKALIHAAEGNSKAQRLLSQLVEMLHGIESQVVIEGIESAKQLAIAKESGADFLQGYFLAEPKYLNKHL
ncbi:EAL domain-containing protein [Iodobacter arcticus]|uniref:EAL domain-containing protein n=1 Tax=Iodobacter arcticus TaxID=590593 RepID=A0ABW2QSB0_9NEIS